MLETLDPSLNNKHWYLIQCKTGRESYAAVYLRSVLNLSVYLPERQVRSRQKIRQVPLFPSYIFLSVDLQIVPLSQINVCPGVLRLVVFGGTPSPIPQYVIDSIKEQLAYFNGLAIYPSHGLRPGDLVHVRHGPLQNLEMVFLGPTTTSERVHVLLELLGRLKEAQVDVTMLEKIPGPTPFQQEIYLTRERYMQERTRAVKRST
jgi:transcriptional antiterminator RfaH